MTIKEMHYDFKQKLNKIDSQQYRDLKVPEIDWKLNEAQELFVKAIAQPRYGKQIGLEFNQRSIDDIRTVIVDQKFDTGIVPTVFDSTSYTAALPEDYWYFASAKAYASRGICTKVLLQTREIQHDDEAELSVFDKSSFGWRISNIRFNSEGIRVFTDGTYTIDKLVLSYCRQPRIIYNAADWPGGTYNTLDGVALTGTQDSELPKGTHREIVDLAVLITAGDLDLPNYNTKKSKVALSDK